MHSSHPVKLREIRFPSEAGDGTLPGSFAILLDTRGLSRQHWQRKMVELLILVHCPGGGIPRRKETRRTKQRKPTWTGMPRGVMVMHKWYW